MITLNQSYTYEELLRNLQESGTQYPESTIYKKVGESHDERPIPMLRVGLGLDTLILTSGIHGKESINPVLLTRMAQEYCQAYQDNSYMGNYPVRELLNHCSICFLPIVNPDGYVIATESFSAIRNPILRQACKMRGVDWPYWKYNARAVDINRVLVRLSDFCLVLFMIGAYNAMKPGRNGILPLKGSVTDAQLDRTPSHLFHGSLHCILSDRVPLARGEYHRPCHLGTLPAGRCHPLLQVRHRPLFCMVRVDPLYPVLSAAARRAQRLLAGLPVPLRRHDHRAELLCPSAHRACSAALPGVWQRHLRPSGADALCR